MGEPVGLTKKRKKNIEHCLNNKSLSYAIDNMKHYFQPTHFENGKFSQKYVIVTFIWYIIQFEVYQKQNIFSFLDCRRYETANQWYSTYEQE